MAKITRGRFGKKADLFIRENYRDMSIEDMAAHLERTPIGVMERMAFLGINSKTADERKMGAYADIKQSVYWNQLKQELTAEELKIFIEHWKEIVSQFRDDIYHTEKLQVMDLIKTEILMSRDLKKEKELNDMLEDLKIQMKRVEKDKNLPAPEKNQKLDSLRHEYGHTVSVSRDARQSYEKMASEKKNLLRAMKASRDQRVKRLEESKDNIHGWLTNIIGDVETRRKIGYDMEKMRIAMQVEYRRLTDFHTYADGAVDTPITNSEVVSREEQEENE